LDCPPGSTLISPPLGNQNLTIKPLRYMKFRHWHPWVVCLLPPFHGLAGWSWKTVHRLHWPTENYSCPLGK